MAIITPRLLSHDQRARLLTGHTTTLILLLSTTPTPHTIPNLPCRMLFAFSRIAAAQLTVANGVAPSPNASASAAASTVTLPTDACTPASLEYVLFWMKQSCSLPATAPLEPLPSLRDTLGVYAAVVALGVLDAEKELYRHVMVSIRHAPLSLEQLRALVEVSGVQRPFVREALRRSAGWARQGKAEELIEAKTWLMQERPELWDVWREFDRKVEEGRMGLRYYPGGRFAG